MDPIDDDRKSSRSFGAFDSNLGIAAAAVDHNTPTGRGKQCLEERVFL